MPRVATRIRPTVGNEQGARRADVHKIFQDMLRTPNQRGSKVPNSRYIRQGPAKPHNVGVPNVTRVVEYIDEWRVPTVLEYAKKYAPIFRVIDLADSLDRLHKVEGNAFYKTFTAWPSNAAPFKTVYCSAFYTPPFYDGAAGVHMAVFNGDVTSTICQTGQSWPGNVEIENSSGVPTGNTINMTAGTRTIVIGPENDTVLGRFKNSIMHVVTTPVATTGVRISHAGYTKDWMQNPNITRLLPGTVTMYQLGYGQPAVEAPPPVLNTSRSFTSDDYRNIKMRVSAKHKRRPPRRREKEVKTLSRSARIALAVFKALDTISEYSELVDAFFRALPQDVQDRWSKGRDPRGLLDSAGQYGIDGADWKVQALWHNWHKIDGPQAFKNIVANEYQDKVLGLIHRNTPVNTGSATSGAMKEVNKQVENFLNVLGFNQ